jgi:hypothetical protein
MFNYDFEDKGQHQPPEGLGIVQPGDPAYKKFLSRIPWSTYQKKRPDLKRHYPEMWGRDLDNHWDPEVHPKPFVVAMKAPDQ